MTPSLKSRVLILAFLLPTSTVSFAFQINNAYRRFEPTTNLKTRNSSQASFVVPVDVSFLYQKIVPPVRNNLAPFASVSDDDEGIVSFPVEVESTESVTTASGDPWHLRLRKLLSRKKEGEPTFRQKLAKMGLSVLLSYGFVSNMSYCVTVSLAWYGFTKAKGLSPLAPGQWKPFLAVYAGFYVFNNFVRPLRVALSAYVAVYFDAILKSIRSRTGCSQTVAIVLVVFLANIVGTTTLMCLGIWGASVLSGVPVFPGAA